MLQENLSDVYTHCKLHFFHRTCTRMLEIRERFGLTASEAFSMEGIMALGTPTVARFSRLMGLSTPNAATRIKSLVQKGCLHKVQSQQDKREYFLQPTQEYQQLYHSISDDFLRAISESIQQRFPEQQCQQLDEMLTVICGEIMPRLEGEEAPTPTAKQEGPEE